MRTSYKRIKPLVGEVMNLAWPAMVQGLLTTVVFFTDRMLLGRYDELALGSMQISGPVLWSVYTVFGAFAVGTMTVVGRAVGAQDKEAARQATLAVLVLASLLGLVLAVAGWLCTDIISTALVGAGEESRHVRGLAKGYMNISFSGAPLLMISVAAMTALQASGNTRTPALVTALGGILNLIVSWIYIYGHFGAPELGVDGAAYGSLLAFTIHALLCTAELFREKSVIGKKWTFPPRFIALKPVLSISLAAYAERVIFHSGFLVFAALIGRLGEVAMATNQAVIAIESIGFILSSGFSIAGGALVAQKLGAAKPQDAEACAWISTVMATLILIMVALLFWFVPEKLLALFSDDPALIALGVDCLKLAAISQPLMAITDTLGGCLRGAGDTRNPMIISFIGPLCLRLMACWFFAFELEMGLIGIWWGTTLDWGLRALLLTLVFVRGNWKDIEL